MVVDGSPHDAQQLDPARFRVALTVTIACPDAADSDQQLQRRLTLDGSSGGKRRSVEYAMTVFGETRARPPGRGTWASRARRSTAAAILGLAACRT